MARTDYSVTALRVRDLLALGIPMTTMQMSTALSRNKQTVAAALLELRGDGLLMEVALDPTQPKKCRGRLGKRWTLAATHTRLGCVLTADGVIDHHRINYGSRYVDLPVCLVLAVVNGIAPVPRRDAGGNLIYALPGGGCMAVQA